MKKRKHSSTCMGEEDRVDGGVSNRGDAPRNLNLSAKK